MNEPSLALEIFRGILIGVGGVILGMASQVSVAYGRKAARSRFKLRMPTHITAVSLSYCMLIVVASGTQLELLLKEASVSWRIPVTMVAYALGIIALRLVLIDVVERRNHPQRRRTDPGTDPADHG